MARSRVCSAVFLLSGFFLSVVAQAQSPGDELAPVPIAPSAEQLRAIASLSPFVQPIPSGMRLEDAIHCIRVFAGQGRWPIRVEYEDGSQYWGEVTEIGANTFTLFSRKTNQEQALSYAGMRGVEIVEAYGAVGKYSLPKQSARRRLPRPPVVLTPEEAGYKLAVQNLGVDEHRFVHCDLPNGKVRTGVITNIRDDGFVLKDGIFVTHWISYTDLKAAPRPVAAVGTKIGQGFKWAGLVAVTIPLLPFAFLFWDGC